MKIKEEKMAELKNLITKINKEYGEHTIGFASQLEYLDVNRVSSGSLYMDWAVGVNDDGKGGFPLGRIVELYGKESSGKTLISLKTISEAQKQGLDCLFVDCENSFDEEFARLHGIDTDKLVVTRISEGEKVFDLLAEVLRDGKIKVIVVDSVAALIPTKELEDSAGQVLMAPVARLMAKGLRKINSLNKETLIIFVNQLRENPGAYGNPNYTPGGNSLPYYASIRVEVRAGEPIMEDKVQVGHVIKFKVAKNKTAPPKKDGYFNFRYFEGIDKVDELVSLGLIRDKIKRKGAYFYIGETDDGYQGREAMQQALAEDPALLERTKLFIYEEDER